MQRNPKPSQNDSRFVTFERTLLHYLFVYDETSELRFAFLLWTGNSVMNQRIRVKRDKRFRERLKEVLRFTQEAAKIPSYQGLPLRCTSEVEAAVRLQK